MPRFSKGSEEFDNVSEYWPQTDRTTRGQRKSDRTSISSEEMDVEESASTRHGHHYAASYYLTSLPVVGLSAKEDENANVLGSGLEVTDYRPNRSVTGTRKPPPPSRSPYKTNVKGTPKRPSSAGAPSTAGTIATAPRSASHTPGSVPKLKLPIGASTRHSYIPRGNGGSRGSDISSISSSPEKGRRALEPMQGDETDVDLTGHQGDPFDDQPDFAPGDNDTLGDMQPNDNVNESLTSPQRQMGKGKEKAKPQSSPKRPPARQSGQSDDLHLTTNGEADDSALIETPEEPASESEQPATGAMPPPKKKRGRPPKDSAAELPNSKKPRQKPPPNQQQKEANSKSKNQSDAALAKTNPRDRASSLTPGIRSNVRERHETPFEEDESKRTRSGRLVITPLAHWKNEHIKFRPRDNNGATVYDAEGITRMDDVTPIKLVHNRPGEPTAVRRRRRRKAMTIFEDSDPEDNEEEWEASSGVVSGSVRTWDANIEAGINELRHEELAFAASKIEPRDNAEGSFRFAKTLTMPFFGSGIVELPPGGIKKTKNSRRMQMMFFVFFGKVTVEVAGTRFAISKGGVWQVPRGEFLFSLL